MKIKAIIAPILLLLISVNIVASDLSLEQLRSMGEAASERGDCVEAIKYLFAYRVIAKNLTKKEEENIDAAIDHCEEKLTNCEKKLTNCEKILKENNIKIHSGGDLMRPFDDDY